LNATYGGDGRQFSLVVVIQDAPIAEYLLIRANSCGPVCAQINYSAPRFETMII